MGDSPPPVPLRPFRRFPTDANPLFSGTTQSQTMLSICDATLLPLPPLPLLLPTRELMLTAADSHAERSLIRQALATSAFCFASHFLPVLRPATPPPRCACREALPAAFQPTLLQVSQRAVEWATAVQCRRRGRLSSPPTPETELYWVSKRASGHACFPRVSSWGNGWLVAGDGEPKRRRRGGIACYPSERGESGRGSSQRSRRSGLVDREKKSMVRNSATFQGGMMMMHHRLFFLLNRR